MDSFIFALTAVFPLFALMALGYFLRRKNIINKNFVETSNKLVFRISLPLLLFINIYSEKIIFNEHIDLIIFSISAILIMFLVFMLFVPVFVKENQRRGVIIQALVRSNFVILGVPLAINMFGSGGIGPTAAVIPVVVPIFNFLAVIALTMFCDTQHKSILKNAVSILKGIAKNPLIIASLIAIVFVYLNIPLPKLMEKSISDIAKLATPLSLIVLGGNFTFKESVTNYKSITIVTLFRLFIIPATILGLAVLFGFRGAALGAIISVFATPVAVSSYIMAHESGGDSKLAGQFVVYTTAFCSLSMFLIIFGLKSFNLI